MHGKAQLEPARHSVVLHCELVPLHNTCEAVCLLSVTSYACGKACSVSQCENLGVGGQKLANRSQPYLDQISPNLGGM